MDKFKEEIAQNLFAPQILKLLKPFSADDMTLLLEKKVSLTKALDENPEYKRKLRALIALIPFQDKVTKEIQSKRWITWFLENELSHKRPDLYIRVKYHPQGTQRLIYEIRKLVKVLFE